MTTSIRHTKTLLSSAAALAILLSAPYAFAQDAKVKTDVEVETEETLDEAINSVDDAVEDLKDESEHAVEMADDMADEGMKTEDHTMETDVEVEMDRDISTTIPCPEGTEIQDDGSCMIIEDTKPDN